MTATRSSTSRRSTRDSEEIAQVSRGTTGAVGWAKHAERVLLEQTLRSAVSKRGHWASDTVRRMRNEFQVHILNDTGIAKATELGEAFSALLEKVEALVPDPRSRALVSTKLQEASFFAKRGMAMATENQKI